MKFFLIFSLLFIPSIWSEVVHRTAPKDPLFLKSDWYQELKSQVPPFPRNGSAEERVDEAALQSAQKNRTTADCARAASEVKATLHTFFGPPRGPLDGKTAERLSAFFEQIRNDSDYFVQRLKKDLPRKRPFLYLKGLEPCVAREVTDSYPSGHAVISRVFFHVLSDLFPEQREAFEKRANQIAQDRVTAGMHHPSDIEEGKKIGDLIYEQMKLSPKFQEAFKSSKVTL